MRNPHATIARIAEEIRHFRNNVTEADRLIQEHLDLAPSERLFELTEKEEEFEGTKTDLEHAEEDRDAYKSVVVQITDAIAETAKEGFATEDAGFLNGLYLIERIGEIIDREDTAVVSPDVRTELEAGKDAIRKLHGLLDHSRESDPAPEPSRAERSGRPERNGPAFTPPLLSLTPKGKAIELRFDGKPDQDTLASLKSEPHRFRWSPKRKAWMHGYDEAALRWAAELAKTDPEPLIRQYAEIESRKDPAPADPEPEPTAPEKKASTIPAGFF